MSPMVVVICLAAVIGCGGSSPLSDTVCALGYRRSCAKPLIDELWFPARMTAIMT